MLISDGTIPKFTSIPIPIKCSISIPIPDSSYNISCGGKVYSWTTKEWQEQNYTKI